MLVYRGMGVGTAKPTPNERAHVPHHLLDLAEPSERFTVARFQERRRRGRSRRSSARPLLVGGSGLYFRAVVDDLEFPPEDPRDPRRARARGRRRSARSRCTGARSRWTRSPRRGSTQGTCGGRCARSRWRRSPGSVQRLRRAVGRVRPGPGSRGGRAARRARPSANRVERRVRRMLDAGWRDEVRALVDRGYGAWLTSTQAIGYAEFAACISTVASRTRRPSR